MPGDPQDSPSSPLDLPHMVPTGEDDILDITPQGGSERFAEEIHALRQDFTEQNNRLLALISQRLNSFDRLESCRSDVPQLLKVVSPHGPSSCLGTYVVQQGMLPNGHPVWKQIDGQHWLYSMSTGKWGIGGELEKNRDFKCDGAYMFCSEPHNGFMPSRMQCTWKRNNPAWTLDASICVQEVGGGNDSFSPFAEQKVGGSNESSSPYAEQKARAPSNELRQARAPSNELRQAASINVHSGEAKKECKETRRHQNRRGSEDSADGMGMKESHSMLSNRKSRAGGFRNSLALVQKEQQNQEDADNGGKRGSARSTTVKQRGSKRGSVIEEYISDRGSDVDFPQDIKKRRSMFMNVESMREKIYANILNEPYCVEDKYWKEGVAQYIAKHTWFEVVTLTIILLNSLWIGYEADQNKADSLPEADIGFIVVENLFCFYFCGEILIRFLAFEHKKDAILDPQFDFDMFLVGLMIFETWVIFIFHVGGQGNPLEGAGAISLLRMLRLTRICRLVRLLRAFPNIMVLIKGVLAAFPAVYWTLIFLVIVIYVFSVAFRILCKENPLGDADGDIGYFASVPKGMSTLLLPGLLPDSQDHVENLAGEHFLFGLLFMVFIVIAGITIMNMLVGILVDVISVVAETEKEQSNAQYVKAELQYLMETQLDTDANGTLSRAEIESLLMNPHAAQVIDRVGVDVGGLVEIAEFHLFNKKDEITFHDFLELVLQLRGSEKVCVRDVVNLRKFVLEELARVEDNLIDIMSAARPSSAVKSNRGSRESGDVSIQ